MKKFFTAIIGVAFDYISGTFEEIAEAIEVEDKSRAIKKIVTLSVAGLGVVGFFALVVALLYAGRKAIFAVVSPVAIIVLLVKSYELNHPSISVPTGPVQQPGTIELAKSRAEKVYPLLKQTAFLLLSELCLYQPGLVKPFSLGAVVPKVHYEITASFVTIHHFIIAKGDSEANCSTLQELLVNLLNQHLDAHDLPLSIPANYTSADGENHPSLFVDGVYDIGQYFRVDLVITNEAYVARHRAITDGSDTSGAIVHEEDFDNDCSV